MIKIILFLRTPNVYRISFLFGALCIYFVTPVRPQAPIGSQPAASPAKLSQLLSSRLDRATGTEILSREKQAQSYVKLLEAQRHIWMITSGRRTRNQAAIEYNAGLARQALAEAIELNPRLDEAYTAFAEVHITAPPIDVDEAIAMARLATRLNPNNFGAHRIMARLLTYKSGLTTGKIIPEIAAKAIFEWSEVARMDSRNAEAWAFLSALYDRTNKPAEQIAALRSWQSASPALDDQFYKRTMGGTETLSPQSASLKLGPALLRAGHVQEAVEVLSQAAVENPENSDSMDLLREAVETLSGAAASSAIRSMQNVVSANPNNLPLVVLLSGVYGRSGKIEEAAKLLNVSASRVAASDRDTAALLYITLGDMYAGTDRTGDAVVSYEKALSSRGLDTAMSFSDDEREFAMQVFVKLIQTLKTANRLEEAQKVIQRARTAFGKDDLFADRELIALYREAGRKSEALAAIRDVRAKLPGDYGFMRMHATLLTELGKVDEGVGIIRKLIKAAPPSSIRSNESQGNGLISGAPAYDDFSNYLFISNLYAQASRGKEASVAASQALLTAKGAERKQLAKLTMASAQQMSGDLVGAETTLRGILSESPRNPIALNNLGYFLLERNERLSEALGLITEAYRIDPTNPSYLDSLGWAYFRLGNFENAERYLKDAARLDSSSPTIQEHLGDTFEKLEKRDLARTSWAKALQLSSDNADIERLKSKLRRK